MKHWRPEEISAVMVVLRDYHDKTISIDGINYTVDMIGMMQTSASLSLDIDMRDEQGNKHTIVLRAKH